MPPLCATSPLCAAALGRSRGARGRGGRGRRLRCGHGRRAGRTGRSTCRSVAASGRCAGRAATRGRGSGTCGLRRKRPGSQRCSAGADACGQLEPGRQLGAGPGRAAAWVPGPHSVPGRVQASAVGAGAGCRIRGRRGRRSSAVRRSEPGTGSASVRGAGAGAGSTLGAGAGSTLGAGAGSEWARERVRGSGAGVDSGAGVGTGSGAGRRVRATASGQALRSTGAGCSLWCPDRTITVKDCGSTRTALAAACAHLDAVGARRAEDPVAVHVRRLGRVDDAVALGRVEVDLRARSEGASLEEGDARALGGLRRGAGSGPRRRAGPRSRYLRWTGRATRCRCFVSRAARRWRCPPGPSTS